MSQTRKVVAAFAVSVAFHVLLFTVMALTPDAPLSPLPEQEPQDKKNEPPLELIIQRPTPPPPLREPAPSPTPPHKRPPRPTPAPQQPALPKAEALKTELDPVNLKKAEKAPENPTFIASHHSSATRPKRHPGGKAKPAKPAKPAEATPPERPAPTPSPALPRPTPLPHLATAAKGFAFRTALPRPTPLSAQPAQPAHPAPTTAPLSSIVTENGSGDDGDDDEVGVAAIGTWKKAVGNAIGSGWNFYRETKLDLLVVGSVRIKFAIDAKGRVSDLRIVSNTANPSNATYAVRSIREAEIPPIPPERLARLRRGLVNVEFTFTILPTQ